MDDATGNRAGSSRRVPSPVVGQQGAARGEWRFYAGDNGSTKYSPLDQINAQNFKTLQVKWSWDSPDDGILRAKQIKAPRQPEFKATPLVVNGRMYVSTGLGQVAALDARTGNQLWIYDHQAYEKGWPANVAGIQSRGVAYWTDGKQARIFHGTYDGYLRALTNLRYLRAGTAGPKSAHPDRPPLPGGPRGLPFLKPPYSRMTAIDLHQGEHVWQIPTGPGSSFIRNHDALKGIELPPLGGQGRGGPLVTKTLLIHALSLGPDLEGGPGGAQGQREDARAALVAYDKATGARLAEVPLPGALLGTPMTYLLDGKQYIAMTVEGSPPKLIALALP